MNRRTAQYTHFSCVITFIAALTVLVFGKWRTGSFDLNTIFCEVVSLEKPELHYGAHYYSKTKNGKLEGFYMLEFVINDGNLDNPGTVKRIKKIHEVNLMIMILEKINLENWLTSLAVSFHLFLLDMFEFIFMSVETQYKNLFKSYFDNLHFKNLDMFRRIVAKLPDEANFNPFNTVWGKIIAKNLNTVNERLVTSINFKLLFSYDTYIRNKQDVFQNNVRVDKINHSLSKSIFLLLINFFYIVFQYAVIYALIILLIFKARNYLKSKNNYIINYVLNLVDFNTSNLSDLRTVFISFSCFFLSFFSYAQSIHFIDVRSWAIYMTIVFVVFSCSMPIFFILAYGVFFLVFINGVEKRTSYIKQLINNVISFVAFVLRFVLQNMRVVLLFVYSWVFTMTCFEELCNLCENSQENRLLACFFEGIKFMFETLDVLMIFFVQIFAFVTVLICLFSFVLLVEENFRYENFFLEKRQNKQDE